ncbi:MAG: tRNA pseudouridine(38-40) synthase TruA [Firmicutes bacterium]|nr:tRNA pseudouridine(38-40) synthase TruA [Bacillota bacterium]
MRNILIKIEYDGSAYSGWQIQPAVPTVQGEIERALRQTLGRDIQINGTSRTDAGVHALGQCASFEIEEGIPTERIPYALNNALPGDIRILSAEEMPEDFHARFSSKGKTYIYKMKEQVSAFESRYCYEVPEGMDFEAMQKAAAYIKGEHDFKCFQASGSDEKLTTVRTIFDIQVLKNEPGDSNIEYELIVSGDGFLYNMVRIITGTLVDVGAGKIPPENLPEIIESKDRTRAGHTAPPQGLYLAKVYYGDEIILSSI